MPVRHLGTYSPWAKFTGGGAQYGYTPEQYESLQKSVRIKRGREEREAALEREKLRSGEKRTRTYALGDIGAARVRATGGLAERKMAEVGMATRAEMKAMEEREKERLVGRREREAPTYRAQERELALGKYATTVGSLATEFTRFITDEETGETRPVVSKSARKIAQKYQNLYLTDPERAVESVKSELAAKKVGMDRTKIELDRWASETGAVIPSEELDVMEGYGDEAETLLTKWARAMRAQEAEVREEEAVAEKPGVPRVRAETWGESLLGRAFRGIKEKRREAAGRRRIGGPVGY